MPATITGIVFNDLNHNGQYNIGEPGIAGAYVVLYSSAGCTVTQTDAGGNYSFPVTSAGNYVIYETVANPGSTCPPTDFTQPAGFSMSNGPRKINVTVTAAQVSGNAAISGINFGHDRTIAPLECSPTMVQFVGTPSNWYNIDVVTGEGVFYTAVNPADNVNAIGYNTLDNYIYGYDQTTSSIVRVDNAGNLITLYPRPTGLSTDIFDAGTLDANGFYYLFESGKSRFYTIDLRPDSVTFMKLVDPANGYAEQTSNYGTALSAVINTADWVSNPQDGYLYGVDTDGTVQRIDPTTGTVTALTTSGPDPSTWFGAVAIDANGNIFAISDSDGSIYHYTIVNDTAEGELFANTVFASFNDATMCPRATIEIDFGDAPDLGSGNGPGNYNTLLAQNGPRHQLINNLFLGTRVTAERDAYQDATATGDDRVNRIQDDSLSLPLPTLSISATGYTLNATVSNQTGSSANLYAWVDFNQNGIFELSEAAAAVVVPSAVGTQNVALNFTVPAGTVLTAGSTFARLRLTTDELVNSGITAEDSRSVGPATDGEVEDYILALGSISDLEIDKIAPATVIAGTDIEYIITVRNNGPDAASDVLITDAVPATVTNPEYSADGGTTWLPWPGSYNAGEIAADGSVEILLRGTVDSAATGSIINTATVSSSSEDPNPDNNTSTFTTTLITSADLSIDKTASPNPATAGENLTFTITVSNAGPSDALNVALTDLVSAQITAPQFSADNGATWNPWTNSYSIGSLPAGDTAAILIRGEVSPSATVEISNTATVASSTPDPDLSNNTVTISVPLASSADLSVTKLASPSPVATGEELTYTIVVTNAGPSEAANVTLSDDAPLGLGSVEFSTDNGANWQAWVSPYTIGTMADGQTDIILIRGTVSPSAFGTLTNTATVESDTPDPNPDNNSSQVDTDITTSAELSITKTGSANPITAGAVLTYVITVTNAGASDAQNVVITDTVPAEITTPEYSTDGGTTWLPWPGSYDAGTLAAGGTASLLLRGTVDPAASGTIANTAAVTSDTPDPTPDDNTATEITAVGSLANISITKSGSPNPAISGQELTYTITASNAGPDDAENVVITDALPPQLSGAEYSTDGGTTWLPWPGSYTVGTLAAGASSGILIHGTVDAAATGLIANTAAVTSDTPDLSPDDNTATEVIGINQSADLSVTKSASPVPVYAGQEVTFSIEVSNAGPSDAAGVVLADELDSVLSDLNYSTDGGTTWQPWVSPYAIGALGNGSSVSILIRGKIDPSFVGQLQNTAIVTADTTDPNPDNNSATVEVGVGQLADLSVSKTASPDPILPGETMVYTIVVSNAGPSTSQSAMLVDFLPSSLSTPQYSIDGGTTWLPWSGSYSLGNVEPGSDETILVRGQLSFSVTGSVTNTATVTSTTPDPDPSNNSDMISTDVTPAADISVLKIPISSPIIAGERETFIIVVSNAGPVSATNVTLTDVLPASMTNGQFSINSGTTWNTWVSPYNLGTLAANESHAFLIRGMVLSSATGNLINTASATSDIDDPNPDNNSATITEPINLYADLAVSKSADRSTAVVGEGIVYTITVANNGPSDTGNVSLADTLPTALGSAEFSTDNGATWQPWSSPYSLGAITSGASRTILLKGTVLPSLSPTISNTAYAVSDVPDPNPTNNNDTVTVPLVSIADISVTKSANVSEAIFGDSIIYTLTIENAGPSPAQNVTLADALPAGISGGEFSLDGGTTWNEWNGSYDLGTFASGGSFSVLLRGTVNNSAESTTTNSATVSSITDDPDTSNNTDFADVDIIFADRWITKSAEPSPVTGGEEIVYTITTGNDGPNTAENVVITDTVTPAISDPQYSLDGGTTWNEWDGSYTVGTLTAGSEITLLIRGTVATTAAGTLTNAATVASDTPDPNPSDNTVTVETPVDASADLTITKSSSPNPVIAGEKLFYAVRIYNEGPSDAVNVTIADSLPAALSGAEYSTDGGTTWQPWVSPYTIENLPASGNVILLIRADVDSTQTAGITNTATVSSDTPDPDPSGNTATSETAVSASADLSAAKTANVTHAAPGSTVIYTITAANSGPSDAEGVTISDTPEGLSDMEFSADGGATWQPWVSPYTVGTLSSGESADIMLRGTVQVARGTESISNTATVTGTTPDPDPDNNSATITIEIDGTADLAITKRAIPSIVSPCGIITYELTVSNSGPGTARETVLTDALPKLLCSAQYTADGGRTWHPWEGALALGDLAAGGEVTIHISATVHPCAFGTLTNTAYVSSQSIDPNPDDNRATTETKIYRPRC